MQSLEEDAVKSFFTTITNFAKSFRQAISDNNNKRLDAEKKTQKLVIGMLYHRSSYCGYVQFLRSI
jgi:hypothetical protein